MITSEWKRILKKIPLSEKIYSFVRHIVINRRIGPIDFYFARRKLLSAGFLPDKERALLKKVSLRIDREDAMYVSFAARHYLSVGLSAMRCIEESLRAARKTSSIQSILDMPSGYGRVLRFLRLRFPEALIMASDIDKASLNFCKKNFSVETFYSMNNFRELQLSQKFDLIWCGSLITHIDEKNTADLLRFFYDHLSPGGLCIFTTHGQLSVDWIKNEKMNYGLNKSAQQELLRQFHEKGYGYVDYKGMQGYGVSIASRDRMLAIANTVGEWREASYLEHGWNDHQDVYGFINLPISQSR